MYQTIEIFLRVSKYLSTPVYLRAKNDFIMSYRTYLMGLATG